MLLLLINWFYWRKKWRKNQFNENLYISSFG